MSAALSRPAVSSYSAPLPVPCGSCPYRRDVPSGIWHRKEYLTLPKYDLQTWDQPPYVFLCHHAGGNLCAGWCGTHDMEENLGLRIAEAIGKINPATVDAILSYTTDVPLFASGREACEHGLLDMASPSRAARSLQASIRTKRRAQ